MFRSLRHATGSGSVPESVRAFGQPKDTETNFGAGPPATAAGEVFSSELMGATLSEKSHAFVGFLAFLWVIYLSA